MANMELETSRPRAGRRFAPTHELAIIPDALQAARTLPGAHRGVVIVSEMTGPFGIPDVTALVGDPARLTARLASPIAPLLNEVDAGVVAVARPRLALSPHDLAAALEWPEETVRRRLPLLLRSGALVAAAADRYVRDEALQPLGRLYAVEAKVRDWRKAMRQVRTYRLWADNYVLVTGRLATSARQEAMAQVTADHAGLVVGGESLRKPTLQRLPAATRLWASEHLVAALRG